MKISEIASEARLAAREREDWANNLQRAIGYGQVKRPLSDVALIRMRVPDAQAVGRALSLMEAWRERLPHEFIAEVERDV
jgi:hypothetical protein